jgi:hypothetical protein
MVHRQSPKTQDRKGNARVFNELAWKIPKQTWVSRKAIRRNSHTPTRRKGIFGEYVSIAESDNLAAQFDRLPPNDVEAERNVLGSGMVDAQAFAAARATVVAEDFYVKDHEIIWRVMCEMVNGGDVVDPLTLMSALKKRGIWDELGGKEGLGRIIGAVVTTAHCEH